MCIKLPKSVRMHAYPVTGRPDCIACMQAACACYSLLTDVHLACRTILFPPATLAIHKCLANTLAVAGAAPSTEQHAPVLKHLEAYLKAVDEEWFVSPFPVDEIDAENQPANTAEPASSARKQPSTVQKLLFVMSVLPQTPAQLAAYLGKGKQRSIWRGRMSTLVHASRALELCWTGRSGGQRSMC